MSTTPEHRAVREYLDDLRNATRDLPAQRRRELLTEIEGHLAETAPPGASQSEVRDALDRLGDPRQIADEERGRRESRETQAGWVEWLAIPTLLLGAIAFFVVGSLIGAPGEIALAVVGWLAGVVLLWLSRIWTVQDKLLATLAVPGGLLPAAYLALAGVSVESCTAGANGAQVCTGGISTAQRVALITLWVVLLLAPIGTTFRLTQRLTRT